MPGILQTRVSAIHLIHHDEEDVRLSTTMCSTVARISGLQNSRAPELVGGEN